MAEDWNQLVTGLTSQIQILQQQQQQQQQLLQQQHDQLLQQQQQLTQAQASPQQRTVSQHHAPEPKVKLPPMYNGGRGELRGFLNQIKLVITQRPNTYAADAQKVALVGQLLGGDALKWFNPLFERNNDLMKDFSAFVSAIKSRFGDPNLAETAARKLQHLRQGRGTVARFATEFQNLAADAGFNDSACRHMFRAGLARDVQFLLLSLPVAETLDELVIQAIRCDNRLAEHRSATALVPVPAVSAAAVPSAPSPAPAAAVGDPMVIDAAIGGGPRAPLTQDEKDRRRREGLCLYCGVAGHVAVSCPVRPQGNASRRG